MDPLSEVNETEGGNIADVPESKFGHYVHLQADKVSELMKLGGLENVSTQSLFNAVNKTLHECVKTKKGDIAQCVASILQLMVQEIQHRFLNQVNSFKKQETLYRSREEKYLLKIKACKTLVAGTNEENEIARNLLHQTKIEMSKNEKTMKCQEQELTILREELDHSKTQVLSLDCSLNVPGKLPEPSINQGHAGLSQSSLSRSTSEVPCSKRTASESSSGVKRPKWRP